MKSKNREILFIGSLFLMGFSLSLFWSSVNNAVGMDLNDGCHLGGSWVGYDDYGQCHFHNIGSDYTIEWSFRSRNSVVNVTAIAIDITNFTIFESSRSFEGFVLSNGTKSHDSGIFRPPNVDIWYIVFWHNDSDTQLVTMLERRTEKIYEPE